MRVIVAPEFSEKLANMSPDTLVRVKDAFDLVENSTKDELVTDPRMIPLTIGQELFALRAGDSRVFLSFGSDQEGDFVLVFDLAARETGRSVVGDPAQRLHPKRNPKFDQTVNPKFNSQINPRFNSNINPRFNSNINPKFNSTINPRFNSTINPRFNSSLNPRFNSNINPKFNSSLNPKFNWSLNPFQNAGLQTQFVYDVDASAVAFIVIANDLVRLVFDTKATWTSYAVSHPREGFVVFSPDGDWVEHWESNGGEGWNRFDLENEWIGFVL